MPERKILAENIRAFRKKYHLSQYEMASECGISQEVLSLVERQIENITLDTLQKFAAFMGKNVAILLTPNEIKEGFEMEITYQVIKENHNHEDIGNYISYGIAAVSVQGNKAIIIDAVSDIFVDYQRAKNFIHICNKNKLLIEHLYDVIDDVVSSVDTI